MTTISRVHVTVSFTELLQRLGFNPNDVHVTRTWTEESGMDYLHLMIEPGRVEAGYVEETPRRYVHDGGSAKLVAPSWPSPPPHMGLPGEPCVLCGVVLTNRTRGRRCLPTLDAARTIRS